MDEINHVLDKFRSDLLSDQVDSKQKVRILRRLIKMRQEPQVYAIVLEATRSPVNEPLLNYCVRTLGYLDDPRILDDLAGFITHPQKLVVRDAVKAAVAIDPVKAVPLVIHALRRAPPRTLSIALKVLARRCPREVLPAVDKLMASRSRRNRLVAVTFLLHANIPEATERLQEILRTEQNPVILDWARRAHDQRVARIDPALIEETSTRLHLRSRKLPRITAPPLDRTNQVEGVAPLPESGEVVVPPPEPPQAPAVTEAVPAGDGDGLLPWQVKEKKKTLKRSLPVTSPDSDAQRHQRRVQALAIVAIVAGAAMAMGIQGGEGPPAPGSKRPVDIVTCSLGAVSSRIRFSGKVAEVHADYNLLLVRAEDGTLASVRLEDSVASFTPGHPVEVEGTLSEIRAAGLCTVEGTSAREL